MSVSERARIFRGSLTRLLLNWDNTKGRAIDAIPNEFHLAVHLSVYSPLPEYSGIPAETWEDFVQRLDMVKYTFSANDPDFLSRIRTRLTHLGSNRK